jgi:hypothetical protein
MGRIEDFETKTETPSKPAFGGKNLYKAEYVDLHGNVERTLLSANDIPSAVQNMLYVGEIVNAEQVTMVRRIGAPEFRSHLSGKPPRHWHGNAETAPPAREVPVVDPPPAQQPLFPEGTDIADVSAYINRCADVFKMADRRGDSIDEIAKQIEAVPVPDGVSAYVHLVDKALLGR